MKNYSDEIFVEKLRSINFPDYSNHTCVSDGHQDVVTLFLSAVDSVSPVRALILKSSTKPWSDIDTLHAIRNRDKHYKKFKQSDKETDKDNFKCEKRSLKKIINNKKKISFEDKIAENKSNP